MSERKRYIIDPGPQQIAGFPYTIQAYVAHYIRGHKVLNNNGAGIRAAMRIETALEDPHMLAKDALKSDSPDATRKFYELRNDDWALLKEIDADPGECGYPRLVLTNTKTGEKVADEPLPKRAHMAFMDAIADAGTKQPEAEEADEKEQAAE